MGGDIEAIIPSVDYPLEYDECIDVAKEERDGTAKAIPFLAALVSAYHVQT